MARLNDLHRDLCAKISVSNFVFAGHSVSQTDLVLFNQKWKRICKLYVDVDCGLTSHSAIFQLYSDGTDVQFPHFYLLPDTQAMGS